MKLTTILLFAAVMQVAAKGNAQTVTYSAKTAPLQKVFTEIKAQTGYLFFYRTEDLESTKPVSVELKLVPLKDALDAVLSGQPLAYSIKGNTVFITKRNNEPKIETAPGPVVPLTGIITNDDGDPLGGATITIKGTSKAGTALSNGRFVIHASVGDTLVVSFVGYEIRQIIVKASDVAKAQSETGKKNLVFRILLKEKETSLHEVVVNKGYYTQKQIENTGSVSVVSSKELERQPVTDPLLALEARVPGLVISQTIGVPGSYSTVQLRGTNSFPQRTTTASAYLPTVNDPLYIVDGVPYSSQSLTSQIVGGGIFQTSNSYTGRGLSPFSSLDMSNIESIEVLKDADATTIYGARGGNGVILITTKKGKAGRTNVTANLATGVSKIINEYKFLNTQQYLTMTREAYRNANTPFPNIQDNPYDGNYDINGVWDTTRNTDWQKVLIGNAASYAHADISMAGGVENNLFLLSGSYNKQGTVFPGNFSDRDLSAHGSFSHSSADKRLKAQFVLDFTNQSSDMPAIDFTNGIGDIGLNGSGITLAPDAPAVYDSKGNLNWAPYGGSSTWTNPLAAAKRKALAIVDNLIGSLILSYRVSRDFQLSANMSYNHTQNNQRQTIPASSFDPSFPASPNRAMRLATNDIRTWNVRPQLNYDHKFDKLKFEGLLGSSIQQTQNQATAISASGFSSDALITNPVLANTISLAGFNSSAYKYAQVFGRLGFILDEKYILNLTGSRDGSSRFGPSRQFANFGSAAIAWVFSKEECVKKDLPWIDIGKLRASYGSAGNDNIGDYQFLSTYSPDQSRGNNYQGMVGLYPTSLTNPYFSWQLTRKIDLGIELSFLGQRINMQADYYRNRTGNQLVGYPLPSITGFSLVQANLNALIQNTGFEIALNTINIRTRDFSWSTGINLGMPRNKLVSFPGIEGTPYARVYKVGEPLSTIYTFRYKGVDPQTGLYTFQTHTGAADPQLYTDDYFEKGPAVNYSGGFDNRFFYKGFELDVFFQFVRQTGNSYIKSFATSAPGYSSFVNYPVEVLNHWMKPGDRATVQQISYGYNAQDAFSNFVNSDGVVVDASFARLKNISLSYQFPNSLLNGTFIQHMTFYVNCQNLLTITKYQGLDPETQGLIAPPSRTVIGGVRLTF